MVDIEKLSKRRKEWLGCWGNIWQSRKVAPGTCPACVFGDDQHSAGCVAGKYVLVNPQTLLATQYEAPSDLPRITAGQHQNVAWVPKN